MARAQAPNEQTVWKRYSPNHECLLSWVGSITGHGLVIGIMILFGMVIWVHSDSARPPTLTVVELPAGDGLDGDGGDGGGSPAPFGQPDALKETITSQIKERQPAPAAETKFRDIKTEQLNVPDAEVMEPGVASEDPFKELAKAAAEAKQAASPKIRMKTKAAGPRGDPKGFPGGKGLGGQGGGPGTGKRGRPGTFGVPRGLTRQETFARRWRFDMSGDGKEHADKLAAIGVILAIPDPQGNPLFVRDLKRRPVELRPGDINKFKSAVHWTNNKPDSVFILARELRLPFVPRFVQMYLPRHREEKMAEAERRFAQLLSRPLDRVSATFFDFRLRNGVYEPIVTRQE